MPLSTVIPAQSLEWLSRAYMPARNGSPNADIGLVIGFFDMLQLRPIHTTNVLSSTQNNGGDIRGYGNTSVAGTVIRRIALRHGRRCQEFGLAAGNANAGTVSDAWRPPDWLASFGPAVNMNPGARLDDSAVVAVFDWNVSLGLAGAAPTWPNDRSGVFFLPVGTTLNGNTNQRGGSAPIGGFAVYANTVAGAAAFEYVSWQTGGAVLERVTIGSSIVPDPTLWNTFRFIIVGAASGREARLTLQANGQDVVVDRLFNDVQIQRPATAAPGNNGATGMCTGISVANVDATTSGDTIFHTLSYKSGRFLPNGRQMQDD
ncbi:MAG: hypothetical protein AB7T31_16825 [Gemmatimonadales bacterium]